MPLAKPNTKHPTQHRVLIVDDHKMLAELIPSALNRIISYKADIAYSLTQAREYLSQITYNLAIIDICLGDDSGLDLVEQIAKTSPKTRIIAISGHGDRDYHTHVLKRGGHAFLTKSACREELGLAVRSILKGGAYLPLSLLNNLLQKTPKTGNQAINALTRAEDKTIRLIAEGKSYVSIADALNVEQNTIKKYRQRALKKLVMGEGKITDATIARFALQHELISL